MDKLIDFHSHILPGIDDGSDSVATSLKLLEQSGAQGVCHMIATPHFYAQRDSLEGFLERRCQAEGQLRTAMDGRGDLPEFSLGAEVHYFGDMSESEGLWDLAISGTDCILVEMPYRTWTDGMYRELENIRTRQGLTPVVAHVERYLGTFSTHGILKRLAELPVLVQCNASFFLNRATRSRALRLLKQGSIHLLGSDCHDLYRRPPNLGAAAALIESRLGPAVMELLQAKGTGLLTDRME